MAGSERLFCERRVHRLSMLVPGIALAAGLGAVAVDVRAALLLAALILGWTQLAGL